MAEYKSIHTGREIDEAVTRALNLADTTGLSPDKMMKQAWRYYKQPGHLKPL